MTSNAKYLILLLAPLALGAHAEDTPADAPVLNQQVIGKLVDMGEYLRSLHVFQVRADVSRDTVLDTGQKIKMQSVNTLLVEGKTHMYAKSDGDARTRELFYNGKNLTQYSPYLKFYTTVKAPATVTETIHEFEQYYGVQVPMEDLFLFGSDQAQIDALKSAAYVGPSTINGRLCDHLAFRQEHADWQLWITRSVKPLPCKLVITTTDDSSFPEYSATYTWNLQPTIKPSAFTFSPAKGDVAIPLKKISEVAQ
ncbi:DUF2092 domain-containing protein [Pseudomonas sp. NA-150]|uniref:DUF2092 domain-containing protein n=1 Tax=Pseudomonas sp. NA-150 TaxID=3367525 RepID=UPI0037C5950B